MINQFTYMQVANYNMNTPYILGQKKKKNTEKIISNTVE